jgi:Periplasmic protease|tara:strand:- start:902 stop:1420 length:519 start_codon:yes stop_codon:yes gene_type:complete
MLVDDRTGSDAELMAESFRKLGLGRVVGTRTWGGLLAVDQTADLIDGSELSLPSTNVLLVDELHTEHITNSVENRGVIPDVEIRISPANYYQNTDPQLDRAVEEALELLKARGDSAAPAHARKVRRDDTSADEIETSLTNKKWNFSTWAPLPPTKEEEEKLRAKRQARRHRE